MDKISIELVYKQFVNVNNNDILIMFNCCSKLIRRTNDWRFPTLLLVPFVDLRRLPVMVVCNLNLAAGKLGVARVVETVFIIALTHTDIWADHYDPVLDNNNSNNCGSLFENPRYVNFKVF